MKKFIVAILAVFYMTASTGATVHLHYCMGQLIEWGLWDDHSDTCGKCGMEKSATEDNGCCKEEQKTLKLSRDQKTSESPLSLQFQPQVVTSLHNEIVAADPVCQDKNYSPIHSPPRHGNIPDYLYNRVFRI